MEIISPGMREGTLYQKTSQMEIDEELFNSWGLACGAVYGMRKDIVDLLREHPEITDSDVRKLRRFEVYTQSHILDMVVNEAARAFAKNAVIKTLEEPFFIEYRREVFIKGAKNNPFLYKRYYPVPEGVLQYFRKELRKRRQKLIEGID